MEFDGSRMIPEHCQGTGLYHEHLVRYAFASRLAAGRRVLDAATGAGYGARMLLDAGAVEVTGVDIEPETVEYARSHFSKEGLRFVVDDVQSLTAIPAASMDLVVSLETIEHLGEPERLPEAFDRILAPDGILIISTPNFNASRCQNPHHTREFTPEEFHELLSRTFPNVRLWHQTNVLASIVAYEHDSRTGRPSLRLPELPGEPSYLLAVAGHAELPDPGPEIQAGPVAVDAVANHRYIQELHHHIQNLEGGVKERDEAIAGLTNAKVELERRLEEVTRTLATLGGGTDRPDVAKDMDLALMRREVEVAQRVVNTLVRINRRLGKLPSRSIRLVRRLARGASAGRHRSPSAGGRRLSVVVPVYEHVEFVGRCLDSVLDQTWADFELVVYDDASPDPRVKELLASYAGDPRVRVLHGEENLGISAATNRALAATTGDYVAFVDCDDELAPEALETVVRDLASRGDAGFLFSNRVDVDETGAVVEVWDFQGRTHAPARDELLKGMFASHLKVVRRDMLQRSGLFRSEFDAVQDYDFVLRLSEHCEFRFLDAELYRHRVHPAQTTLADDSRHQGLADRARDEAIRRRKILRGEGDELISIVVLSLDRLDDTLRCLRFIEERTKARHEIILVDNGSRADVRDRLHREVEGRANLRWFETGRNLGCGGGRNFGVRHARGDLVAFLDNDVEVTEGWLENLVVELTRDDRRAACCARVVFPNRRIQYTGGTTRRGEERIRFELVDTGKAIDDLSTLEPRPCDWVPGGATLYRREVLEGTRFDEAIAGAYEDNDWCLSVAEAGWTFSSCPLATVFHHHIEYNPRAREEKEYVRQRYDPERLRQTVSAFHRKHGVYIEEEELYRLMGYASTEAFIREDVVHAR